MSRLRERRARREPIEGRAVGLREGPGLWETVYGVPSFSALLERRANELEDLYQMAQTSDPAIMEHPMFPGMGGVIRKVSPGEILGTHRSYSPIEEVDPDRPMYLHRIMDEEPADYLDRPTKMQAAATPETKVWSGLTDDELRNAMYDPDPDLQSMDFRRAMRAQPDVLEGEEIALVLNPGRADITRVEPPLPPATPRLATSPAVGIRAGETAPVIAEGKPTVADIGGYFDETIQRRHRGRQLDLGDARDRRTALGRLESEGRYQLEQPVTGIGWYDEDVERVMDELSEFVSPRFADPEDPLGTIWRTAAGSTSFGTRVPENAREATQIMQGYLETGRLPSRNPATGGLWSGITGPTKEKQLELQNFLIDKFGEQGYRDFVLSQHPLSDLTALRRESGLYGPRSGPPVAGRMTDPTHGAKILGPKGGAFVMNLSGLPETTVDLWATRTANRQLGRMLDPKGGIVNAPRNEAERLQFKDLNRRLADRLDVSEQDAQALMWYFEQGLFSDLGVPSNPQSFSEGVRRYRSRLAD